MSAKKRDKKEKKKEREALLEPEETEIKETNDWDRISLATTVHIEEDFPRGGKELITPLERRKIIHQAEHDDIFGKKSDLLEKNEVAAMKLSDEGVKNNKKKTEAKEPVKNIKVPDRLYHKDLREGLLILCAIKEVQQYRLLMSLPFNMTGSVNIGDVSDPLSGLINTGDEGEEFDGKKVPDLSKMYRIGQLLSCYILKVNESEKQVQLSINPKLINNQLTAKNLIPNMIVSGCVTSIEDHGYIIDFGVSDRTGFLLNKNTGPQSLSIGQVISTLILPGPTARALPLSIAPDIMYSSILSQSSPAVTLPSLLPGQLLNVSVKQTTPTSLIVSFLGGFEGYVHYQHLPTPGASLTDYAINKKLKARVLWLDTDNKKIGLTLQNEIVKGIEYDFSGMEIGLILHEAIVTRVESRHGVILKLPNSSFAYSPVRLMYSERTDKISRKHCVGSVHSVRIVQYNYIDGLAIVSMKESTLEEEYFTINDVTPGSIIKGNVTKISDKGISVSINNRLNGFCPLSQLSDSAHLKKTLKKLSEGSAVKCRVLKVDPDNNFILLTKKKSLVSCNLPPLTDVRSVKPGEEYTGEIINIVDKGLIIRFYNNITGFLPNVELSSTSSQVILSPSQFFKIGQVLQTRVLSVDIDNNKVRLSLRKQAMPTTESHAQPGDLLECEVTGVAGNGVSLLCNDELIFIPTPCLSDYTPLNGHLLAYHGRMLSDRSDRNEKYIISNVLVLSGATSVSPAVGCIKKLIIDDLLKEKYPKTFEELHVGMVLVGVVKRIYSYGVFIEFPNGLVGLAPFKYLSDEYITDTVGVYGERQTVFAKVHELNEVRKNITISLKCSDLKLSLTHSSHLVQSIVLKQFANLLKEKDLIFSNGVVYYRPGALVKGQINNISSSLFHVTLESGQSATGYVSMATGGGVCPGDHVTCCVVDVDMETGDYWVSLNSKMMKERGKEEENQKKKGKTTNNDINSYFKLEAGHTVTGHIEYINNYYLVCSVSTLNQSVLAYGLFDSGQWGVIPYQMKHLKPGAKVNGTVLQSSSLFNGKMSGPPIFLLGESNSLSQKIVAQQLSVAIGDIVDAKIIKISDSQLSVSFGPWKGRIHSTLLTDDMEKGSYPLTKFSVGDAVKAKILKYRKRVGHSIKPGTVNFELTTRKSLFDVEKPKIESSFTTGDIRMGVVREVTKSRLLVDITPEVSVVICPLLAGSNVNNDGNLLKLTKCFNVGRVVECTVGDCIDKGQYHGSLTGSLPVINIGETVCGRVIDVQYSGLVLSINHYLNGIVHLTNISDYYISRPLQYFNIGDKLSCVVIGKTSKQFTLSLRKSHTGSDIPTLPVQPDGSEPDKEINSIADLQEVGVVRGYVSSVTKYGIFVKLGPDVVGRIMLKNLSDQYVQNYESCVNVGDLVRAKVVEIDNGQIELSLRLSDIDESAGLRYKKLKELQRKGRKRRKNMPSESTEEEEEEEELVEMSEGESDTMDQQEEIEEKERALDDMERLRKKIKLEDKEEDTSMTPLPVTGGWDYDPSNETIEERDDDEDTNEVISKKKSKRQKKAMKKAEELQLYKREHSLMDTSRLPQSADDFDRLLVANPNSSSLWLQYMAFYLHTAEVDKARATAERGLAAISFREEDEKLNLWVGFLNLENMYGDSESLDTVFKRALQQNDQFEIYTRLINIYVTSNKPESADQLYQIMCKKFSSNIQVWSQYGRFLMEQGKAELARKILQRSFKSLTKKQHVDITKQFAQFEFKYGEMERGCTLFENLVSSYPRKVDIWSVYIDMLTKKGEMDRVRDVFERAVSLKLSSVKKQFLYKRYIEFERRHGTQSLVETVQAKSQALL